MAVILAVLCFFVLVLVGYGFSMWLQQRIAAQRDLMNRLRSMAGIAGGEETRSLLKDQRLSGIPAFDALLSQTPVIAPLVRTIQQAGLRRRVGEVLLYIPLLASIAYLFCALMGLSLPIRIVVTLVLGMLPILIVARIRSQRLRLFGEQLPDSLDLVRSAL